MLALAQYESSSEDESPLPMQQKPPTSAAAPAAKTSQKRKAAVSVGGKSKKILPASLLPPEIQAALAGKADLDSDSDSEAPVVKRAVKGPTLFSRLPAPTNDAATAVDKQQTQRIGVVKAAPAKPQSESDVEEGEQEKKKSDIFKEHQGEEDTEEQTEADKRNDEEQEDDEDGDAQAAQSSAFPQQAAASSSSSSTNVLFSVHADELEKRSYTPRVPQVPAPSVHAHAKAAAAPVTAAPQPQAVPQPAPQPAYAAFPNEVYAATYPQQPYAQDPYAQYPYAQSQPQLQQYAAPDAAYSAYAHLHAQAPAPVDAAGKGKSARRRDREIEQQLLAGNTAVLGDATVRTVQAAAHGWDPVKYSDRAKQEAQVMSAYKIGKSADGGIMAPNRTMNRRHQITSLAYAAAQMELQLLDSRGQPTKTKAQTQAKYGW